MSRASHLNLFVNQSYARAIVIMTGPLVPFSTTNRHEIYETLSLPALSAIRKEMKIISSLMIIGL